LAADLTPGGVESACHPSEVAEMSTTVLEEEHSINGTTVHFQEMIDTWQTSCHMQEQKRFLSAGFPVQ